MTLPFTPIPRVAATLLACVLGATGAARAADTAVFEPATGTLRLPQVVIGTAICPRVTLTRPGLELLGVGGLVSPPSAAQASMPGAITTPFPTLENITVESSTSAMWCSPS